MFTWPRLRREVRFSRWFLRGVARLTVVFFFTITKPLPSAPPAAEPGAETHRLYDGITVFVNNTEGRDFTLTLGVQDLNLLEKGPREVLVKAYSPAGNTLVREVIEDDGVISGGALPFGGGWDHEAWYYAQSYIHGLQPLIRWSAFSAPDRLATIPKRTFIYAIKGGVKGIYRILIVGCPDHYVTFKLDPGLAHGVCSNPWFLHGTGEMFRKSYIYIPRGAKYLELAVVEYDLPRTRKFTLKDAAGKMLWEGQAEGGAAFAQIKPEQPGEEADKAKGGAAPAKSATEKKAAGDRAKAEPEKEGPWDDQIFTFEVGPGEGDFMVNFSIIYDKNKLINKTTDSPGKLMIPVATRGQAVTAAVFAPDAATARAVQGGAIYHDNQVFWQMNEVRLYEWLKKLKPEDFEIPKELELDKNKMPTTPGYIVLNGPHWQPPLCDKWMHDYQTNKNPHVLNASIKDLAGGLRGIGPNDHTAGATFKGFANLGYEFGTYAYHYWRPGWRILQQSDAPEEVKAIIRDAFINAADRLAFCRTWARVNGNSFALVVAALRYGCEATKDPLNQKLFETYFDRFANGGWGERAGVGASGAVQEGFGYDHHYGAYMLVSWKAIIADLKDPRFIKIHDRVQNLYSYTQNPEAATCPWSSRTPFGPQWGLAKEGPFQWKGDPGPDFTVSVNDGNEWFAARRSNYYVLTYHGRLTRKWEGDGFLGQIGYGGGVLCQLNVPGKGLVLGSTLNGGYGTGMHPSEWRNFHIHSLVGMGADGKPLVAADSEHFNARLEGNTVTGSGQVRDSSFHVTRSYTFGANDITCQVDLKATLYDDLMSLWMKNKMRGIVTEAYEMIPFVGRKVPSVKGKRGDPTAVTALDAKGKESGPLSEKNLEAQTIVIDRGGFGVRVEFEQPMKVKLGQHREREGELKAEKPAIPEQEGAAKEEPKSTILWGPPNTILIQLADTTTEAAKISLKYRLVPYGQ